MFYEGDDFIEFLPGSSRDKVMEVMQVLQGQLDTSEIAGLFCALGLLFEELPNAEAVVAEYEEWKAQRGAV